jgi:hypothetical protein
MILNLKLDFRGQYSVQSQNNILIFVATAILKIKDGTNYQDGWSGQSTMILPHLEVNKSINKRNPILVMNS